MFVLFFVLSYDCGFLYADFHFLTDGGRRVDGEYILSLPSIVDLSSVCCGGERDHPCFC